MLVALWIGVIGLAKAGRGGAWWTMLAGVSLLSLGLVVMIGGSILVFQTISVSTGSRGPGPSFEWAQMVMIGGTISLGLGFLLYAIGFALHGFQARRVQERIVELEMVIEAQNEQLARAGGGPAA